MTTRPSIKLYKYLPARYAVACVESRQIRVSTFDTLNDPYEITPCFLFGTGELRVDEELFVKSWKNLFVKNYGMISMSTVLKDPVLWAHYADSHQGIVLEFDCFLSDNLVEVKYNNARPVIDLQKWDHHNHTEIMKDVLRIKWESWRYENEYRSYVELEKCVTRNMLYFWPIPDRFLTRIILGNRCTLSAEYMSRALKQNKFTETEIVSAKLSNTTYEIEV